MNREMTGVFELRLSDGRHEVAYLRLPTYPKDGILKVSKSPLLSNLIGPYDGPDVVLDFDSKGILVGIEVVVYDELD